MTASAPAAKWHAAVMAELAKQGHTRNWLHRRSGVARNTIDRWATQPHPPQAGTVLAVAKALGLDHAWALRLAGVPGAEAVAEAATPAPLGGAATDDLLAELRRRIEG